MGSKIGVLKIAAKKLGLTFDEYNSKIVAGLKYCWKCGDWKGLTDFAIDRSRGDGRKSKCFKCDRVPGSLGRIPLLDLKRKARNAVNTAVNRGLLQSVKTLNCVDCGNPAHEYDHYKGYDIEHHFDVQPLCYKCHRKKDFDRRKKLK